MSHAFTDVDLAGFMAGTLDDDALIDAIEAALDTDPVLAARVEALAADDATTQAVRDAFAPVLDAPVPEYLKQIVAAAPGRTLPTPANDTANDTAKDLGGTWRWPQFGAMAASLALGVLIGGPVLTGGGGSGDATVGGSLVLASADVTAMLDSVPSGQAVDLASLGKGEVVLTFRNADGRLCRQFMIEGRAAATSDAVACAGANSAWQIEAFGRRAAPAGEMKLAGGDAAPAVVAAVDAMIASDPLLGADEAALLKAK